MTAPTTAAVTRRLIIADMARQYPLAACDAAPVLVVELAEAVGDGPRAMEFLASGSTAGRAVTALGGDPLPVLAEPLPVWSGTDLSPEFAARLREALPAAQLSSLAPIMLLRTHTGAAWNGTEVLMLARMRTLGSIFVKVGQVAHAAGAGLTEVVTAAFGDFGDLPGRVRAEGAYLAYEKGVEIEEKVTLRDDVSIWAVTKNLWRAVEDGEFPGFIPDPGYELTRWQITQHNFEVTGAAGRQGHFGFMEGPDGGYYLRMKSFTEDALRREETFREMEIPDGDFEKYLAHEFPELRFRRLPSFVRTRFDVNVQSVTTGHCFGIETDEVTVIDGDRRLRQIEME